MTASLALNRNDETNEELVRCFQNGEADAFGILWQRLHLPVYRYCYRCLDDREAAMDAMSETFTKALVALPKLRPLAVRNWLFSIAHNVIIDQLRQRRPELSLDLDDEFLDEQFANNERESAIDSEDAVGVLLRHLSVQQRNVVALRLLGFRSHEIAAVLGKTQAAVEMTYTRALTRLRDIVKNEETTLWENIYER